MLLGSFFADVIYILSYFIFSFYTHSFKLARGTILLFVLEHARIPSLQQIVKNLDSMLKELCGCEGGGGFVGPRVVLYIVE